MAHQLLTPHARLASLARMERRLQAQSCRSTRLPGDTTIDIRVFVDRTFVEIFVLGGRIAATIRVGQPPAVTTGSAGMVIFAEGSNIFAPSAYAWAMAFGVRVIGRGYRRREAEYCGASLSSHWRAIKHSKDRA